MTNEADDGVLAFARRWRPFFQKKVELLSSRKMTTSAIRDGRLVDTTDETLAETSTKLGEIEELIARHEAWHAQRPKG